MFSDGIRGPAFERQARVLIGNDLAKQTLYFLQSLIRALGRRFGEICATNGSRHGFSSSFCVRIKNEEQRY